MSQMSLGNQLNDQTRNICVNNVRPPQKKTGSKPKGQQPRNVPSVSGGGSILTHNGGKDEHAGEKVGNHK